jgi:hypothetical protein
MPNYGICPTCGRVIAVKKGCGPHPLDRGDVRSHRDYRTPYWCYGGKALPMKAGKGRK